MTVCIYITHPEVRIDPDVPVPEWGLSDFGRARAVAFAGRTLWPDDAVFISSTERKALEMAQILSGRKAGEIVARSEFGENDRSATGFLPPDQFEVQVDRMFRYPGKSACGWEPAVKAQIRIARAVGAAREDFADDTPLVFVGHGCVGTLLKCHIAGRDISRDQDQGKMSRAGGGNLFAFDLAAKRLLCDWTAMENWQGI